MIIWEFQRKCENDGANANTAKMMMTRKFARQKCQKYFCHHHHQAACGALRCTGDF
jgi:hypothetical protein